MSRFQKKITPKKKRNKIDLIFFYMSIISSQSNKQKNETEKIRNCQIERALNKNLENEHRVSNKKEAT